MCVHTQTQWYASAYVLFCNVVPEDKNNIVALSLGPNADQCSYKVETGTKLSSCCVYACVVNNYSVGEAQCQFKDPPSIP